MILNGKVIQAPGDQIPGQAETPFGVNGLLMLDLTSISLRDRANDAFRPQSPATGLQQTLISPDDRPRAHESPPSPVNSMLYTHARWDLGAFSCPRNLLANVPAKTNQWMRTDDPSQTLTQSANRSCWPRRGGKLVTLETMPPVGCDQ